LFKFFRNIFGISKRGLQTEGIPLTAASLILANHWGNFTESGITVTPQIALEIPAVYRAVSIKAQTTASLELNYLQFDRDGRKTILRNHPLTRLIEKPSVRHNKYTWFEVMESYKNLRGNGFSWIKRDQSGFPTSIEVLSPDYFDRVELVNETDQLLYYFNLPSGRKLVLDSEDVIHVKNLPLNGESYNENVLGISPITLHRETFGNALATTRYAAKTFKNGAFISGYLKHPGVLKPDSRERLQKTFRFKFGGVDKSGQVPVLEGGTEFIPVSLSPHDAQYIENAKLTVEEFSRIFGVPMHLISQLDRSTFSNIEQQNREYVMHSVRPSCIQWQYELKKLIPVNKRNTTGWEFNLDSLLQGDTEARAKYIAAMKQNRILTTNEIRRQEGFNDHPDGDGLDETPNMINTNSSGDDKDN